ncbi:NAD-dependent succinate-semialdehyde dehydrogenase [Thalassomonas viridans]|uniref:NAD-dependent succinate-semialdehyde dehydrogenase n=1 Tax=Thalassomonas viridans TaxID=137584 RepID=A0AAE9Z4E1_9GAMM|nr:NAD-dependent succinate-semialdehyde dehydrogenase [Thalassomonas viridans]WDE06445.1 NAD-dependent succinate-semialdehyde dehydrogenase [Thalassomonas viridans]
MEQLKDQALFKRASFINGEWVPGDAFFPVINPASGQVIAEVADAGVAEAGQAIEAAKNAFNAWSSLTANARGGLLRRWFDLINQHRDDLARILTLEQGKPLAEAEGEIGYGASFIDWFAEEGKRAYGDVIPMPSGDKRLVTIKQAVGVVTAITPWNFPHAMIARKAAAALAAGCTFVVRPATQTPLSALAMAELAQRAGIPAGVFNVVTGSDARAIGRVLTEHPDVAKFTFTGSTEVGKQLIRQSAGTVKKVSMELGGNAPFIVFDDADLDAAVQGAIISKYRNAGQTCVCANRIFVQEKIAAAFTDKFVRAVAVLKVGDGLAPESEIGPLISPEAAAEVDRLVHSSLQAGARLLLGGEHHPLGAAFYRPTVVAEVTQEMALAQNEIFGPVSPVITFKDETEVLAMANDTDYGLAAYFYARDIGRIWRVAEGLAFGMVGINEGIISNAAAPFGGIKQSGNGREGSRYGLDDYMEIKYLCFGGVDR